MKNLLIFISFILVCSCSDLFECKIRQISEREESWFPKLDEKWNFSSNNESFISFTCVSEYRGIPRKKCNDYDVNQVMLLDSGYNASLYEIAFNTVIGNTEGVRSEFVFASGEIYTEFPIRITQSMACLSIADERPCRTDRYGDFYFYHSTKELNGNRYENVIEFNDPEPNRIPEVDISRFYVNQKGILRIEFYGGEVWDRVF